MRKRKMRKIFGIALASLMLGGLVAMLSAACVLASGLATTGPALAAAPANEPRHMPANGEAIHWIGQSSFPAGTPQFVSVQSMCQAITDASGGALVMQIQPAGTYTPMGEEFDAVHEGVIDFAVSYPVLWTDKFPAAGLFYTRVGGMPPMHKHSWFVSGGGVELAQQMIDDDAYNVHVVPGPGLLSPAEIWAHSTVPIKSVKDIKGLRIRTAGDGGEVLTRMGASVVFLPGGELYEAMQRGVIDAFEYSTACLNWQMALNEVAQYVYVSGCRQPHDFSPLIINGTRWDELPGDLKEIVQEDGTAETIDCYAQAAQDDVECLQDFVDYGCQVEELSGDVEEAFIAEADDYYDELASGDPFFAQVLQSLRDYAAEAPSVRIEPGSQTVSPRGTFSVDVVVDSTTYNLKACHVEVSYDSSVFTTTAADITYTGLLGTDILTEPGSGVSDGLVHYGVSRLTGNDAAPVSGAFITIAFTVSEDALSDSYTLDVHDSILKDENSATIPGVAENDGQVTIIIGKKGDFDGDGHIGFDDFVAFADAYGSCVGGPNYSPIGDFDDSGCIDFDDFVAFGDVYGTSW